MSTWGHLCHGQQSTLSTPSSYLLSPGVVVATGADLCCQYVVPISSSLQVDWRRLVAGVAILHNSISSCLAAALAGPHSS